MIVRQKNYWLSVLSLLLLSNLHSFGQNNSLLISENANTSSFPLVYNDQVASIMVDKVDAAVVKIAARAFQSDVEALTGKKPEIFNEIGQMGRFTIVAGTIGSNKIIDNMISKKWLDVNPIKGRWECFTIQLILGGDGKEGSLVIAGSDRRGTAYGIFHLSRLMGVSPFIWWADVVPAKRKNLFVSGTYISSSPSVRYRGIFINDEDWGLQPWASKKMDTAIKDIGPHTYARIFELMLRLKANYVWPAMHPSTKAFYFYKANPQVADDYAIVIGSSHAEPMLRNNVFEWAVNFENEYRKKPGEWRYDTNKEEIHRYWNDRVKQSASFESVFTVGMRGVHDSGMPGPKDPDEKLRLLEQIIVDQRLILKENLKKPAEQVPQIFVPYKEVLSLYRKGMKLPDDVTIIWPDDNHGYIRQLPNDTERKRRGGHGVYYHLSYWGAPADYLWLSTISPALISFEMTKAYKAGASRLWVFNVGDIKPAEMELQFAMDLAWEVGKWPPENAHSYANEWAKEIFGKTYSDDIAAVKNWYYQLAAGGKPEHMNLVGFTYSQAKERISQYYSLRSAADLFQTKLPAALKDAYFELMYYPIQAAALLNIKILQARLSFYPDSTERAIQRNRVSESREMHSRIQEMTRAYNKDIAAGKWDGIMSWHPRDQAVFKMPPTADSVNQSLKDSLAKKYFETRDPEIAYLAHGFLAKNETSQGKIQVIKGLGFTGTGVTSTQTKSLANKEAPSIEFNTSVPPVLKPGVYDVIVTCLPTFDVVQSKQLRYSIGFGTELPQTANIHVEADSREWRANVIRGYSTGKTTHQLTGNEKVTVWFNDPGLVIFSIEFYKHTNTLAK